MMSKEHFQTGGSKSSRLKSMNAMASRKSLGCLSFVGANDLGMFVMSPFPAYLDGLLSYLDSLPQNVT
jgi:hypothetical protein